MGKTCLITLRNYAACSLLLLVITLTGCRKKVTDGPGPSEEPLEVEEIANTNDPAQPVITISPNNTLLPTKPSLDFVFDWEQATQMPVPPGKPIVPMPWSDLAIRNYDPGLRYDYKKSDGWELLYSSFSDSRFFDNRIFILYNKYRGLLRYYSYNPRPVSSQVTTARWLINELSLEMPGNTSPVLNFSSQDIVNVGSNTHVASLVEPWPLQESGWYISQFELAYDNNWINYPVPGNDVSWVLNFARVDEVLLNNTNATDKPVYLQVPGVRFVNIWSYSSKLEAGNIQLNIKSGSGLDQLTGIFPAAVVNDLKQSANAGLAGNMLSATLIPGTEMISCRLGVNGSFSWNPSMVGYVPGLGLALPGPDNSKLGGLGPIFNEPTGVFYLASKPVIRYKNNGGSLPETYTLNVPSVSYIINPFIQNYAAVGNFKQEIVALDEKETKNLTEARMYTGKILKASKPLKILGVRVSFDVTPKNGSKPIKLIKTFKAEIENS